MYNSYFDQKGNKKAGTLFGVMMGAYLIFSLLLSLVLSIFKINGNLKSALSTLAILLASIVASIFTTNEKKSLLGLVNKKFSPIFIVLPLTISFSMIFGLGFTNSLVESLFNKIGIFTTTEFSIASIGDFVLFTVFLALIPAVAEELFFRGVLISNLKTNDLTKVLISALCFSLYHLAITKLVYQFIYGVVLGLLFIRSRNLILPIITHFLNNFIIIFVTYFNISINLFSPVLIVTGLVVLALSVFMLTFKQELKQNTKDKESVKNFFASFSLVGFIICLVVILSEIIGGVIGAI